MRWAARLYRQATRTARPLARCPARLVVESLERRDVPAVTGTAFIDVNLNGFQDAEDVGVAGVTVKATDPTGATETVTTGEDGTYTLQTDANDLRIEFSTLPEATSPGRVIDTAGPLVRFLTADSDRSTVDLALGTPQLVTTQFFFDDALFGWNASEAAVVAVPYGADSSVTPTVLASVFDVGSVWGLAYNPKANALYTSSFLKRHAGFGPAADLESTTTGGIYQLDPTGISPPVLLIDLNTAGSGLGAGADPHPKEPDPDGDWFHDAATLPLVGKRSLGGLAVSADGRTLYTVNLNTRQLLEIPLAEDGTWDTDRAIRRTTIPLTNPAGSGITGFDAADLRPFAITVRNGAVFVGVTYTAETDGLAANLRAFVFTFDPAQGAFRTYDQATATFATSGTPAPVLTVNLNYPRGRADDPTPDAPNSGDEVSANWRPWTSTFRTQNGQEGFPVHPSPWLTDIAFDGPHMVLGLRDRFGDQGGFQTGNTASGSEDQFAVIAVGDILRAAPSGAGWAIESNGSAGGLVTPGASNGQGPGGGEFYHEDSSAEPVPDEVATGGLAQVPGFRTIAATGNDPVVAFGGGIYTFFNAGGTDAAGGAAGRVFTRTALYESADLNTFGSANGLGDLTAVPAAGTVQVGDRVFQDTNGNGLQDVGEPGIAGVVLALFQGNTEVDSISTGEAGEFLFEDLQPNTAYQIRIDTTQSALAGRTLATANQGANDQLDSDATLSGTTATVAFTTGDPGTSDHSLDVGFGPGTPATPRVTIGNLVFRDANGNGTFDAGDTGIAGVTVELLDQAGTNVLATTTTAAGGTYTFPGRDPGTYRVRLAAGNFTATGPLVGFTPSTPAVADPNTDADNDSNGVSSGTLGSGGSVVSGPVAVTVDGEPTTDGDDNDGNLTVDFGLVPPAAGTLTLGNLVWNDANNNGLKDAAESGIAGITVQLMNTSGAVLETATTAADGSYSFANLGTGDYKLRLPSTNFTGTNPLVGFTSSTGTNGSLTGAFEGVSAPDPNGSTDNDDNGRTTGLLGTASGSVETGTVTLSGSTGNANVDFGLFRKLSLGNTVFNDQNNNGTQDAGEPGIANVAVRLLNADASFALVATTTTNAVGQYLFTNLVPGNYVVDLADTNFRAAGPLFGFQSSAGLNNAFEPAPAGATDKQDHGTATGPLGSGGSVQSRTIALTATGPTGENPNTDPNTPDAQTELTVDFGLFQQTAATASVAGRVFRDFNNNGAVNGPDSGISGVTVSLSGGGLASPITVQTDATGNFTFNNLAAGTYTLTQTQPTTPANQSGKVVAGSAGGTATAASNTVSGITLTAGKAATGYLFAEVPLVSTGGSVYEDTNGNGIKDAGEPGIPGVTLTLTGTSVLDGTITPKTAITDATGAYTFSGLTPGTYAIAETQPAGYTDGQESNGSPPAATVTNDRFAGINLTTVPTSNRFNFGEVKGTSLGGFVYVDANDDGARAATGEPGIAGVKLRLTGTDDRGKPVDRTTTTGADGSYLFGSLRPGNYRVVQTQPAGYIDGKETAGTAGGDTETNDRVTGIQVTSGTAATGYLFGEQARAKVVLTQTPGTATIRPNGTVTLTYTLRNRGTALATAAGATINFGGMTFVSASTPAEFDATTRAWTAGDLAPGETKTIRLTLRGSATGTFTPSARATGGTGQVTANKLVSSVVAVGAATPVTPTESPRGFLSRLWFLSSSTNARRGR